MKTKWHPRSSSIRTLLLCRLVSLVVTGKLDAVPSREQINSAVLHAIFGNQTALGILVRLDRDDAKAWHFNRRPHFRATASREFRSVGMKRLCQMHNAALDCRTYGWTKIDFPIHTLYAISRAVDPSSRHAATQWATLRFQNDFVWRIAEREDGVYALFRFRRPEDATEFLDKWNTNSPGLGDTTKLQGP